MGALSENFGCLEHTIYVYFCHTYENKKSLIFSDFLFKNTLR